ncbi:MAG TPA: UDP-N-acetylmuramoyl-tripeptide--D-alanyl-D-alanine ligase [Solirubrobacteraceae bacterium]|jgi:UDP-N-acetylmuramoyl-tripeptide--D-alanyl-D-alanine ligase
MRSWSPEQIAQAAGARLLSVATNGSGPERAVVDSRDAGPGALFVGVRGTRADGGQYATDVLRDGAWGVLTSGEHAETAAEHSAAGVVLAADDPLVALQRLATAWRRELGAAVIGVTGSTGKTSTKDLLLAVLAPHRRTVASRGNFNTEVGLPLEILAAPAGTEVLVLEMAMRGAGQIAELAAIAEPDVGVIVSVGPVHLELLGSLDAIAAAKAELLAGLAAGATAVVPAGEPLLERHLRDDLETVTFGDEGDVRLLGSEPGRVEIGVGGERIALRVNFEQAHLRDNLLAAVAAARAVGATPSGSVELALSPGRGQRAQLTGDVMLIDDCYNANPMSMRAALDELAATARRDHRDRRVAVLGDMLELGETERQLHERIGEHAAEAGVDLLITVGPLAHSIGAGYGGSAHSVPDAAAAAELVPGLLRPGDVVLVKGSRGVGLELVCRTLSPEDRAG